jgi:hypothetical protein
MWCIHTTEYYSVLKMKEIWAHAAAQINLDDIMLSEMNRSQNTTTV